MGKVVVEFPGCVLVVAVDRHAALRCRIDAIFLVTIEAVVAKPETERDACWSCIVVVLDAGPQDTDLGPAGSVIEACGQATKLLGGEASDALAADADQVDSCIRFDPEQRQRLVLLTREFRFAGGECKRTPRLRVQLCRDAGQRFSLGNRHDNIAGSRHLEGQEVDAALCQRGRAEQEQHNNSNKARHANPPLGALG